MRRQKARNPDESKSINLMKVVLHICCGVCAAGAAEVLLSEGHRITGYFYNPNIYPEEEYHLRLKAARRTAEKLKFDLVAGPYDIEKWNSAAAALGGEPEGGESPRRWPRSRTPPSGGKDKLPTGYPLRRW